MQQRPYLFVRGKSKMYCMVAGCILSTLTLCRTTWSHNSCAKAVPQLVLPVNHVPQQSPCPQISSDTCIRSRWPVISCAAGQVRSNRRQSDYTLQHWPATKDRWYVHIRIVILGCCVLASFTVDSILGKVKLSVRHKVFATLVQNIVIFEPIEWINAGLGSCEHV